jgi:hypothetical protein
VKNQNPHVVLFFELFAKIDWKLSQNSCMIVCTVFLL